MHVVLIILVVALLVFGPQVYVRHTLKKYSRPHERFPGSGGQLARHLLDGFGLNHVKVESTSAGDHYDPRDTTVRLSAENLEGKSLTAIAVAAHEVGHALQHAEGYPMFELRSRMVILAAAAEKAGAVAMLALPLLALLSRSPAVGASLLGIGVLSFFGAALVHLVTLPVEWDASFKRALPVLVEGGHVNAAEEKAVHKILRAAALTYVAASLASLLNLGRWISILRH